MFRWQFAVKGTMLLPLVGLIPLISTSSARKWEYADGDGICTGLILVLVCLSFVGAKWGDIWALQSGAEKWGHLGLWLHLDTQEDSRNLPFSVYGHPLELCSC